MMQLSAKHPKMEMKNPVQRIGGGGVEQIPADWNQTDETAVDYIKNKPENLSDFNNDMGFLTQHQDISGKADKTALNTHTADTTAHITANERTNWNNKVDSSDLANVAFSGDYDDLTNCPIGVSSFTNDAGYLTAHQDISGKANTADLASVAFSGSYNDLSDKPVEPEITTYDIQFEKVVMTYGKFNFVNTEDSHETIFEKLRNGTARINRIFNLTYDPVDTLPSALVAFPEYELDGIGETSTGYNMYFKRTMSFTPAQYTNPLVDVLAIAFRIDTKTFSSIYHSYKQMTPSIIIYTDFEFADQPYPHAIKFSNAGGRWGKTNLASVKKIRAGYSSDFNFVLRVSTHGDNVWLRPTETVSTNALPRFIGESEKLRKRVVVTFADFTDNDNPTATMDLQDLIDDTHINGLIDDKLPTARVAKTASDTTATIDPNKLYVWPTMASLNISLNAGDSDIVNEYHFIFTSGTTATNLTLPQTVKKPYGFTVEANTTYEVSILENCMVVQRWEA